MTKVSVNIITYNREDFLSKAIDSVLVQSFKDWELIIVDDCSIDNTAVLVSEYIQKDSRIKYFKNDTNLGIGKSRNLALQLSSGKYIAVLDSDDYWSDKNKLQKQFDLLESGEFVLVGGGYQVVDRLGNKKNSFLNPTTDGQIRSKFLFKNPFVNSSVMFKKDLAVKSGGYDESLQVGEDYDLFLRLGRLGRLINIPSIFVNYCQHGQNVSRIKIVNALEDNLVIINRYKNDYPNYFFALLRRSVRLFFVKIFLKKT
ncbi:MAG: glycosyltransferase [Candidatus Magasanikbacteria bacterium]|jgi:glycosyltransferase involved in cell wall biosynthesis